MGIHNRGDFDLKRHQEFSGVDLSYKDQLNNISFIPWDIETSAGVDRSVLFLLIDAFVQDGERTILKLNPRLSPYKVAVFPLLANKEELVNQAKEIYENLRQVMMVAWDDRGNIGKRYFAQDEAGTPYCVTVDFQTLEDKTVTVRDRDSAKQERIKITELQNYILAKIG